MLTDTASKRGSHLSGEMEVVRSSARGNASLKVREGSIDVERCSSDENRLCPLECRSSCVLGARIPAVKYRHGQCDSMQVWYCARTQCDSLGVLE
jgi:hypothetical protein